MKRLVGVVQKPLRGADEDEDADEGEEDAGEDEADEEDEELSLQYRNNQSFAIGHGCAAGWEHSLTTDGGSPPWVETCFLPRAEIKPVTTVLEERSFPEEILSLQYLLGILMESYYSKLRK